jgi:hypothetical protein
MAKVVIILALIYIFGRILWKIAKMAETGDNTNDPPKWL